MKRKENLYENSLEKEENKHKLINLNKEINETTETTTESNEILKKYYSNNEKKYYWYNTINNTSIWIDNILEDLNWSCGTWIKKLSLKYNKEYYYNVLTNESSWIEPIEVQRIKYNKYIEKEKRKYSVNVSNFPWLLNDVNIPNLVELLRNEDAHIERFNDNSQFRCIFTLNNDSASNITRAYQEEQMLNTVLQVRRRNEVINLPSFWEVWFNNPQLVKTILESNDKHEAKWQCRRPFGYKLATNFMPGYAKSIYKYFGEGYVLDPCAGWGDRILGADAANNVNKYIGFDPNLTLRTGYINIMKACGKNLIEMSEKKLVFSNNFEIRSYPFEIGSLTIQSNSVDFVFTSPPFFEYEIYSVNNPKYTDWIVQFYEPFVLNCCRCVKPGGYVGIYIGDTVSGEISSFINNRVHEICPMRLIFSIAFNGIESKELRGVWIFQKNQLPLLTSPSLSSSSSFKLYHSCLRESQKVYEILQSRDNSLPYSTIFSNWVEILTNPLITNEILTTQELPGKTFNLLNDGNFCIGGTKQRLLGKLLSTLSHEYIVYAGPALGMAQVALGYTAAIYKKKAVIFLNGSKSDLNKPLCRLAQNLGVDIRVRDTSSTLQNAEEDALAWVNQDPSNRFLSPFGLRKERTDPIFQMFHNQLKVALKNILEPRRIWLVGGSGFIFDVLSSIWPNTKLMIVQVGKKIWREVLEGKNYELFIAPERFGETGLVQPPYHSIPWYDAKLWQFVKQHGENGDYIWNVAILPDNPEQVASETLRFIEATRPYPLFN